MSGSITKENLKFCEINQGDLVLSKYSGDKVIAYRKEGARSKGLLTQLLPMPKSRSFLDSFL